MVYYLQKNNYDGVSMEVMDLNHQTMSQTISELRKKYGLSQQEFGERIGVSNRAVSKWENGLAVPSIDTGYQICKTFHISLDSLFSGACQTAPTARPTPMGMASLRALYRIGRGPSSSHTIGPERACRLFKEKYPSADRYQAVLFGSLAQTGEGHGTQKAITKAFSPFPVRISCDFQTHGTSHPNTLELFAFQGETQIGRWQVSSVGGGEIQIQGQPDPQSHLVYPLHTFAEIAAYCNKKSLRLWEYVQKVEGEEIWEFLDTVWSTMKSSIQEGLQQTGVLPGGLGVQRKAKHLLDQCHIDESAQTKENRLVCAYAFAVSEQNADSGVIVTAPTCGASGVLPAVLYYEQQKRGFGEAEILKALATAGLIGNLIKTNASISGAECGCQAEVGSACSMAAAGLGELFSMRIDQIEYAAEVALEHHLGLTCDPVCGLVQIPCIERNAVAAMRAINAVNLANFLSDSRKISFDLVVKTMYETGKDMSRSYRETSEGGLAKLYS